MKLFIKYFVLIINRRNLNNNTMIERDEVNFNMQNNVRHFMNKNKSIWNGNQIITDCMLTLDTNIKSIQNATKMLLRGKQDITGYKKSLRKELTPLVFMIKEALRLYYRINGSSEDMQVLIYPISKLKLMTENNFYVEACRISKLSITLATALVPLGITQVMIDRLRDGLEDFNVLTPQREKLSKKNAAFIKLIPVKINETRLMFKEVLDAIISTFMLSYPEFYDGYKLSRRRILKPGKHKHYTVEIEGKLTDNETSVAVSDVIVVAGKKKKTAISDIKGIYKIKIYIKDADTITFSHEGYETSTLYIPTKYINHKVVANASLIKSSNIRIKKI